MKNAFSRIGRTCARVAAIGGLMGGLMASGLFAAREVTVTIPHDVTVGSTTLPGGEYTISDTHMPSGDEVFLIRSASGKAVTLQASKIDSNDQSKTEVVFTKDGDTWRFDKMFVQGEESGYQFVNVK